jgi:hypothetical protein
MPDSKHNGALVVHRPSSGKTRMLILLDRAATTLIVAIVIGILALSLILASWAGVVIASLGTILLWAGFAIVDYGFSRLKLSLMRRGIHRLLANSDRAIDPLAWVIADYGRAIIADAKRRRYYIYSGEKWYAFSSTELKRVELMDRSSRLDRRTRTLLLSGLYVGRVLEFQIVDGDPERVVAALQLKASSR